MIQLSELPVSYGKIHLPAKVALVVTQKPESGYNLITIEWFMRTSLTPPMFAISIGKTRYSHECLEANRYFNLVFPSPKMKPLLALCGSNSGRDMDKFAVGKVEYITGKLHKLPVLKDAVACFECEIAAQIRSGDHTIYIGEVHYSWENPEEKIFYFQEGIETKPL
ncbi:MAG TPA: flavin reductase family protein [Candidatus Cloacimonas sp.]|jgi:flavin reductase (DIM6/NTAB) family NADH-FMN oxidoreductase RutF|nr:flavin reductase family protein [Candidatus Cloacimonas sp.]